jgi:hypothetical protein
LIEGYEAVGRETMLRFGQVLSAPRAAAPSKTVAAPSNPQTQPNREVTEGVASRVVKPIAAKRSQDSVFSVEEFWINTRCGTRGAGEAKARFATLFSMTRPPPRHSKPPILRMAPFKVLKGN